MELSANEQRILEAIQAGHQFIYKLSIETGYSHDTVSKYVKLLVEKGHVKKGGVGNNRLFFIPSAEREQANKQQTFILHYYDKLPRRELAARLWMAKTDLNMLLLEMGIGQ